jgi:hypothetical protein
MRGCEDLCIAVLGDEARKICDQAFASAQRTLLDLEYIVEQLADFYEPQEARLWLYSRQKLLSGSIPAELIRDGRAQEVITVIDQLRDSVHV